MQLDGNVPALFAALAAAKCSELWKSPTRNREVTVHPRKRQDGSQPSPYKFKYATLDELIDCTEKALASQGLSVIMIDYESEGRYYLRTMLVHAEGGSLSFQRELGRSQTNQERGSELTYSQRYSYKLVLCLAADDDDDANAADGNEVTSKTDRSKPPEPQPRPARPAPQRPQAAPAAATPHAELPPAQKPPVEAPKPETKPQGPPPARPAGDSTQIQARELIADLGYGNRWPDRMKALTGKAAWPELSPEERVGFVSSLRTEKRLHATLTALGYDGAAATERAGRDIEGFTSIALMGDEEMAMVLGQLEREAKMREISLEVA